MITKDGQKIKEYSFIDRMGVGLGYVKPKDGEEIIGRVEYHGDHDEVFIEHRKNGQTIKTVNPNDVSDIVFDV